MLTTTLQHLMILHCITILRAAYEYGRKHDEWEGGGTHVEHARCGRGTAQQEEPWTEALG